MDTITLSDSEWRFHCQELRRNRRHLPEWKWTESEWENCNDFRPLLVYLGIHFPRKRTTISSRRKYLIAAACCREVWDLLGDERLRRAVSAAEQFANGEIDVKEKNRFQKAVFPLTDKYFFEGFPLALLSAARAAASCACESPLFETLNLVAEAASAHQIFGLSHSTKVGDATWKIGWEREIEGPDIQAMRTKLCQIIKDVCGNPFRKTVFQSQWCTASICRRAKKLYDSGNFEELPALTRALEEAGCTNTQIMNHLRDHDAKHVRGCWVIDGLLATLDSREVGQ